MWWELFTVSCGAVRADWRTEMRRNKQENPVVDKCLSPTSNRPTSILWALVWQRINWSKSKLKLHTFQYIQKNPSRLPFYVCYSTIKQQKENLQKIQHIPMFLCFHIIVMTFVFVCGAPCNGNAWHDVMCTNTTVPTGLLHINSTFKSHFILCSGLFVQQCHQGCEQ